MNSKILFTAALALLAFSSCGPSGQERNVEIIQDMMDSPALKPQESDPYSAHNRAMRVPPERTIPRGGSDYKYKDNPQGAESLVNPIKGEFTEEMLMQGRNYYETFCMVCHGITGKGDGTVAAKMAVQPPSLHGRVTGWSDGRIYHVIRMGQGVMGAYGAQIKGISGDEDAIWAVVNYVRHLQKENKE